MNLLQYVFLLGFTATLGLSQSVAQDKTSSLQKQPEAFISRLYNEVVARHPIGIARNEKWRIFAPYLSKVLQHKIEISIACSNDWDRQNPDPNLKPEIGWLELGIFSGGEERALPTAFKIEKTQLEKDGSFHVYVKLTWHKPPAPIWTWPVAVVVVRENGHFVVDDIIYLKDGEYQTAEVRFSEILTFGCNGPRWVGFGDKRSGQR
jgi:hypothetical protein